MQDKEGRIRTIIFFTLLTILFLAILFFRWYNSTKI